MLKNKLAIATLTILIAFVCFPRFKEIAGMGWYHILEYKVGRDQQWVRREENKSHAALVRVKCALPPGALLAVGSRPAPTESTQGYTVQARYLTFPIQVLDPANPGWTYLVFFENMKPQEQYSSVMRISDEVTLVARPGHGFTSWNCGDTSSLTRHWALFYFAVNLLAAIACGILIMSLFDISIGRLGIVWFVSSCYLLGNVVLNFALWPLYTAGMLYTPLNILLVWYTAFAGLLFFQRNSFSRYVLNLRADYKASMLFPAGFLNKALYAAAFVMFTVATGSVLLNTVHNPVNGWDPFTTWVGLTKKIVTSSFDQNGAVWDSYPKLWNFTLAPLFAFLGNVDFDDHALWILAVMIFALIGQCIGILRLLRVENGWEYVAVTVYWCIFNNNEVFVLCYADVPLTAYFLGGVAAGLAWLASPQKWNFLLIGLIFGVGMVSTKLEGTVGVVVIAFALALCIRGPVVSSRRVIIPLLFVLPIFVEIIWVLYLKYRGLLPETGQTANLFEGGLYGSYLKVVAILLIVKAVIMEKTLLFFSSTVGLALWVFIANRRAIGRLFMYVFLLFIMMHFLAFFSMFGWPLRAIPAWWPQALYRLLMHAEPLAAIVFGALLWGNADQPDVVQYTTVSPLPGGGHSRPKMRKNR